MFEFKKKQKSLCKLTYCDDSNCEIWAGHYGVAPHNCYWKLGKNIGQSEIKPFEEWKEYAFLPDVEGITSYEELLKYGSCGSYYCPKCLNGQEEAIKEFHKEISNYLNKI